MPMVTVLPHPEVAPDGARFDAPPGMTLCDALLDNKVEIEHACGKVGACTTCHVIVREGFDSLNPSTDKEEDMLDRAWGLEAHSRLSCQAIIDHAELLIDIPKYSLNQVREAG